MPDDKDDEGGRLLYTERMKNTFVLAFLFLFHFFPGGTYETHCSSGERLHTPRVGHGVCIPCQSRTFIAEEHHFFRECKNCTEIENPDVEVLVGACDSSHDAVILCTGGFYRRRARNIRQKDRCEKCTECPFPARPCEGYYNTVCCPPNHDAVLTPDGVFVCNERPIVCGAGQFFRTSSEECLSCPAGTFMSDHSHTYKDCLTCEELSENNLTQAVITRPCSRTAPTLFGCKAGYFRDPTQESLQIEVPCTPCRICGRRLVDCGMFHDAVCDDKDRMVSTAATNLKVSIGDGQNINDYDNDTTPRTSTDVPESCHVTPTQTSSYVINILLVGEILLYFLHSCMCVFKCVFKRVDTHPEGFQLGRILLEVLQLYRDYYLSLFIVSILLRVLIFLYYNGYFGGFAQDDILTILAIVSGITLVIYFFYLLLTDNIKDWLKSFWGIICLWKRRIQTSVNRWLIARSDGADDTFEPQTEKFIYDPESRQITTAM